jgi:hypothetical protein
MSGKWKVLFAMAASIALTGDLGASNKPPAHLLTVTVSCPPSGVCSASRPDPDVGFSGTGYPGKSVYLEIDGNSTGFTAHIFAVVDQATGSFNTGDTDYNLYPIDSYKITAYSKVGSTWVPTGAGVFSVVP